jgi:hypothetical protein
MNPGKRIDRSFPSTSALISAAVMFGWVNAPSS